MKHFVLFILLLIAQSIVNAQAKLQMPKYTPNYFFVKKNVLKSFDSYSRIIHTNIFANQMPCAFAPINLIKENTYSQNLGFVCKKELQLEKATKIPFRFRLGSLDYCNKLEGKK
jgi:hypothetical protein